MKPVKIYDVAIIGVVRRLFLTQGQSDPTPTFMN